MNQPPKYTGSQIYLRVYSHLIATAERRERTTYSVIATLMGLPPSGNHMGREIGIMLGEISEAEHAQQRPMLSAIVVNTSGIPGPGFFVLAQQLGRYQGMTKDEEVHFWHAEEDAVGAGRGRRSPPRLRSWAQGDSCACVEDSMRYMPNHRELRLGMDLITAIGSPEKVNLKPYVGGIIVTAEGHPDLDVLDELRTVRRSGVVRVGPEGAVALGLVEGYYRFTLVTPGQALAMPYDRNAPTS